MWFNALFNVLGYICLLEKNFPNLISESVMGQFKNFCLTSKKQGNYVILCCWFKLYGRIDKLDQGFCCIIVHSKVEVLG